MTLAGEEGWLFTGRLSLKSHPWLSDHAAMGQVLMPGTGFLELALAAGERVGAGVVEELTLERPLLFADPAAVQIQLSVSEPDEDGKRSIGIYSRPQDSAGDDPELEQEWTRHASGVLADTRRTRQPRAMPRRRSPSCSASPTARGRRRVHSSWTRSFSTIAWRRLAKLRAHLPRAALSLAGGG